MTIYKEHTRLSLIEGGNVFKQGDHVTLGFTPRDYAGNVIDLTGKAIDGVIYSHRQGIMYQAPATFDAAEQKISFTIDGPVDYGQFQIEFTVTDASDPDYRLKLPSAEQDGRLTIKPSVDNMDFVGVQMTTVTQLQNELQTMQTEFEGEVLPRVQSVEGRQTEVEATVAAGVGAFTEDTEVVLARMGEDNLRIYNEKVAAQLAETGKRLDDNSKLYINALNPPIPLVAAKSDGTDTSGQINALLQFAETNKIKEVRLPGGDFTISYPIRLPLKMRLSGAGTGKTRIILGSNLLSGGIVCDNGGFHLSDFSLLSGSAYRGIGVNINQANNQTTGAGQNWLIENIKTEYFEWALKGFFTWCGIIRNCYFFSSKYGLHLDSQSNNITIEQNTINTVCGDNLRIVNSAAVIVRGNNITQYNMNNPTLYPHTSSITLLGGSTSNILFDTNYFEGSFEDVALFSIGQSKYKIFNINVRNNVVTGHTIVLRVADLFNLDGINFENNSIPYRDIMPFKFHASAILPVSKMNVSANFPGNWGFKNQGIEDIAINGSPISWSAGTNTYPDAWTKDVVSNQTVIRDTDGSYAFTTDTIGSGFSLALRPFYCYYPTVKMTVKASMTGEMRLYFYTDIGNTAPFTLNVTTAYTDFEFVFPLYGDKAGLATRLRVLALNGLAGAQINIKNIEVYPNANPIYKQFEKLSYSCPTHGTWRAEQYVRNAKYIVAGSSPNKYIVKGWHRLTTGTTNVIGTDWLEDKQLIGQ